MSTSDHRKVRVFQSGLGPYGQIVVSGRHVGSADEPESLGGQGTGPDPYELLMSALGACTAMTLRMYADRKGWPLTGVDVTVTHAERFGVDGTKSDRFDRAIVLLGELDAEQHARLLEIADRCPVSQTLQRGSEVTAIETLPVL
jgi:putative redox protein